MWVWTEGTPSIASLTHHRAGTTGGSPASHCATLHSGQGLARSPWTSSSAAACKRYPTLLPSRVVASNTIFQGEEVSCLCVLVGGGTPLLWLRPEASPSDSLRGSLDPGLKTSTTLQALPRGSCWASVPEKTRRPRAESRNPTVLSN